MRTLLFLLIPLLSLGQQPVTDDNIYTLVEDWNTDEQFAIEVVYGHISNWDVSSDTGLACETGISEILDKSNTDGKIYNLLGQEINRRKGIYIEGGEVKYRF